MASYSEETNLGKKKARLASHLLEMKASLPGLIDEAFERYYAKQAMTYLKTEERVFRIEALVRNLEKEAEAIQAASDLRQIAGRVNYVADELDRIESAVYRRARRRRRRPFNLADFFGNTSKKGKTNSEETTQEVNSLSEAYTILELDEDCSRVELQKSFRRLAKKHHPDARGGDRSNEKELRRVVEAYQLIKEEVFA